MINNDIEKLELRFVLSRLQNIFNPIEKLIYRLICIAMCISSIFIVIQNPVNGLAWCSSLVIIFISLLLFRGPMHGIISELKSASISRFLVITSEYMGIGTDDAEYWITRKPAKLGRGLFRTNIIRHAAGYSVVIPEQTISFEQLEQIFKDCSGPGTSSRPK